MEMRWDIAVSANSSTTESGSVGELSAIYRTGWSAGLTFWYVGGYGKFGGSSFAAFAIMA
jgi:hypothetical protein